MHRESQCWTHLLDTRQGQNGNFEYQQEQQALIQGSVCVRLINIGADNEDLSPPSPSSETISISLQLGREKAGEGDCFHALTVASWGIALGIRMLD